MSAWSHKVVNPNNYIWVCKVCTTVRRDEYAVWSTCPRCNHTGACISVEVPAGQSRANFKLLMTRRADEMFVAVVGKKDVVGQLPAVYVKAYRQVVTQRQITEYCGCVASQDAFGSTLIDLRPREIAVKELPRPRQTKQPKDAILFQVAPEDKKWLKTYAAERDTTMTEVLTQLIHTLREACTPPTEVREL